MRPARQPVVLGPEWDGHCEEPGQPQLLLNIVAGTRPGGSGKAAGELGTGQEAWSRPTAAAGRRPACQTFLSTASPHLGNQTRG